MAYAGPGRYRHYKGGEYEVLGEATITDLDDCAGGQHDAPGVVYRDPEGTLWVRALEDFNATVVLDGGNRPVSRFRMLT